MYELYKIILLMVTTKKSRVSFLYVNPSCFFFVVFFSTLAQYDLVCSVKLFETILFFTKVLIPFVSLVRGHSIAIL